MSIEPSKPHCPSCLYPSNDIICPICRRQSLSTAVSNNLRSRSLLKGVIWSCAYIQPEVCNHLMSCSICAFDNAGCPAAVCIHCLMLVDCICVQMTSVNDMHINGMYCDSITNSYIGSVEASMRHRNHVRIGCISHIHAI